jgi:hypothetical protein
MLRDMKAEASTSAEPRAKPAESPEPEPLMIRIFLIALAAGVILAGIATLYFGLFPPQPVQHHVEQTLPNTAIKTR